MIYRTQSEAYEAAQKLRQQHIANEIMVRVEKSAYGKGFQVKMIPIDLMIDGFFDGSSDMKKRNLMELC